jgi:hypothetical protein
MWNFKLYHQEYIDIFINLAGTDYELTEDDKIV